MAVTKKVRFDVFKRDGFTCQYCGNHPPDVTLELDHINPKSKGGDDDVNNLLTSCFDCNRGKSNHKLSNIPKSLLENKNILEERESQYKEYRKVVDRINKRIYDETRRVEIIFTATFLKYSFTETFRIKTVKKFIDAIGLDAVIYAMTISCEKFENRNPEKNRQTGRFDEPSDMAIKYFCGICWNKIKNNER